MDHNREEESPDAELREDRLWMHDPDGPNWAVAPIPASKKRGRPRIPEKWTRVISITHDSPLDLAVYEIESDQATMDMRLPYPRSSRLSTEPWKPLFLPKQYSAEHPDLSLEGYRLS
jgi:hypothetical protein